MNLFKRATAYIESLSRERKVRIGLGLVFISSLFFAWSNLLLKQVVEDLSPFTVAFWRGTVGMLIVLILGRFRMKKLLGVKRGLLLTRGLLGVTALTLFFISVKSTTLSNAVGLFHTYPLFTTLIGVLFFKERWRNVYMLALFLSLGGVLLIVRPELGSIGLGELISLVCVFFVGWVLNLVRYLRKSESVLSIIFYFTAVTSVVSFFPAGVGEITHSVSMWGGAFRGGSADNPGPAADDGRLHLLQRIRGQHHFTARPAAHFHSLKYLPGREIQLVPRCRFGTYLYLWLSHSICEKGLNCVST